MPTDAFVLGVLIAWAGEYYKERVSDLLKVNESEQRKHIDK